MDRRKLLASVAGMVPLVLAGCGQSDGSDGDEGDGGGNGGGDGETTTTEKETSTAMEPLTETETASPTSAETPTETAMPTETPTETATDTPLPAVDAEIEVGPDSKFRFDPETASIPEGGTVRWIWKSGGHNVKPDKIPSDSDWSGTEGGNSKTFSAGHTYTFTFDVPGTYDYFCVPHKSVGMRGTIEVG